MAIHFPCHGFHVPLDYFVAQIDTAPRNDGLFDFCLEFDKPLRHCERTMAFCVRAAIHYPYFGFHNLPDYFGTQNVSVPRNDGLFYPHFGFHNPNNYVGQVCPTDKFHKLLNICHRGGVGNFLFVILFIFLSDIL